MSLQDIRFRDAVARRFRPFLRPGVWLVGLVAAVYAAAQLAKSLNYPSKSAWGSGEPLSLVLVTTGVTALICTSLVFAGYTRTLRRHEENLDLETACKGAWHLAVRELQLPRDDLERVGVHVWSVRGFKGARFLERRAKFTLQPRRETRVIWRKGTGAIGTAWKLGEAIIANVENLERLAPTLEAFCQLPRDDRYGLTWREFKKSNHYRAILAIPLEAQRGGVVGCLSIDLQLDGYADRLDNLATVDSLSTIRDVCEKAIAG